MPRGIALVTGASSGIGYWLAQELARRGYDLIVCSAGDRLENAAEQLRAAGTEISVVQADLATREVVSELWSRVESAGRELDIVCINAGVGLGGLFCETDLDTELKMVELNCVGAVQLAKYVVQAMRDRSNGKILFTSSIAGEMVA